jgi:hypothetical protein
MGEWDGKMKYLAALAPEDLVHWLVRDGEFVGELPTNFASQEIDADVLWDIRIRRKQTLLHLEFQLVPRRNMGYRMWKYNVEAFRKYRRPVKSIAVYLQKPGNRWARPPYQVKLPDGERVHDFRFSVVELCKIEAHQLVETGLPGLLPLLPLTRHGKTRQTVEQSISGLLRPEVKNAEALLWLTYGLSGLGAFHQ